MQKRLSRRTRLVAAERDEIVAAYRAGGLSGRELAAEHGIAVSTLYRWLRQTVAAGRADRSQLIEIPNVVDARSTPPVYRLLFARGLVLEVTRGFALEEVRCLAQVVQSL